MQYVVIVNGKPESGKTSFEEYCYDYIHNNKKLGNVYIQSSIDPLKDICKQLGWDGKKTDKWRDIMCKLKQLWIDTCDGPTKYLLNTILRDKYTCGKSDIFYFIDIREPAEINKLKQALVNLQSIDIICYTLFISRAENDFICSNDADSGVGYYIYDYYVNNDMDPTYLQHAAMQFVDHDLLKHG